MAATQFSKRFLEELKQLAEPSEKEKVSRFFHGDTKVLGVSFGKVFALAKRFAGSMPLDEVERLLESPYYEARMGGASIMDFQARAKRISENERKALFDLYIRRHDGINNWDMVDRAAPYVVGGYLAKKPRGILYELARSANPWERRTAIVATYYFIRSDDVEDTFRVAEILVHDPHELVQKAVGSWIREAGKRDEPRLRTFLDAYASSMPRVMLRYAVEKLTPKVRAKYLASSSSSSSAATSPRATP